MDSGGNNNFGRGGGGAGGNGRGGNRGRGRGNGGGGRGNYQNQGGGGRGNYQNQEGGGRGNYQNQDGSGRGNYQNQDGGGRGNYQNQGGSGRGNINQNQGGGRGWDAASRGAHHQPANRQQEWASRTPQMSAPAAAWNVRPWGPPQPTAVQPPPPRQTPAPQRQTPAPQRQTPPQPSADDLDIKISEQKTTLSSPDNKENQIQPIKRPDKGGQVSIKRVPLLVNHYRVSFNPEATIFHYDVDVKPPTSSGDNKLVKKSLRKPELCLIKDKLFSDASLFCAGAGLVTAYDGEKNIFSAVRLPEGKFTVNIAEGEGVKSGSYTFTIKCVNQLQLSKLNDYMRGSLSYIPRDILQAMDLVMKENPSKKRISIGRSFYSKEFMGADDLGFGLAAYRGFQQSLKPTTHGLALCLDYSILAFIKPLPVIEFLKEHFPRLEVQNINRLRREITNVLKGLKVTVNHRRTKQKYVIAGLSKEDTRDIYFDIEDPEGKAPPQRTNLVDYFKDKWRRNLMYQNIPCLELGKSNKSNKVPIECCVLVEGQRYPKELLDKTTAQILKKKSVADPWVRHHTINEMVWGSDGPCGDVADNFGILVDKNMTKVLGRVIGTPELKLGAPQPVRVNNNGKCDWNLLGKAFVDGKPVERWVLLDLTDGDRDKLHSNKFIGDLRGRCRSLGIRMEEPLLHHVTRMYELSSVSRIEKLLNYIVEESSRISEGKLQLLVCAMTKKDPGYKNLKWVADTKIGVVTQCCLASNANKGRNDQFFANLCLKINAKLGGSNFELAGKLTLAAAEEHIMFIGADVNHPAPMNKSCPSIAAVVGTVNWPAANRYAARISPQTHRCEKIVNFGAMCMDLVNTYARFNKVRPKKIVIFRDGVSEGQFEMVLGQELHDLKTSFRHDHYEPKITVVVAQKRHQTRLFLENGGGVGRPGNVPPGTVVDTDIVHPIDFDFYLCSHYGSLGTSKPTHYYVLWDENAFLSDALQKLIYEMCYTFVRCTKPVSLVPPVYYADLVAYRGRMFQEVLMETESYRSSSSSSSSPFSTPSFNASFYSLHPNLKNFMFFV